MMTESLDKLPRWFEERLKLILMGTFIVGIFLTGWLFLQTTNEVLYSGDLGLKYLMLRQYAQGDFSLYLNDDKPDWVKEAWDAGLYPIKPPFVIQYPNGRIVLFPIWFQLLSTPFYILFGFRGLYILPTVALWLAWWRFTILTRVLKFTAWVTIVLVVCFIFAIPLLVYGAIFWEHTLAILLTILGLEFAFRVNDPGMTLSKSILMGALFGLSVWIRPESFLIAMPISFFLALRYIRKQNPLVTSFILSFAILVCGFLITNWVLYKFPLGTHGTIAVVNSWYERLYYAYLIFIDLLRRTWFTFPLIVLIAISLPVLWFRVRTPSVYLLTALVFVFMAAVPFLLVNSGGKQWGARYLFVVFPALFIIAGFQLEELRNIHSSLIKSIYLILFLTLVGIGIYKNAIQGSEHILYNYGPRVKPAVEYLEDIQPEAIAAGNPYVAQLLAPLYNEMNFFLAEDDGTFDLLTSHLHKQSVCQFVYMMDPYNDTLPSQIRDYRTGKVSTLTVSDPVSYGIYDFYQLQLSDCGT